MSDVPLYLYENVGVAGEAADPSVETIVVIPGGDPADRNVPLYIYENVT